MLDYIATGKVDPDQIATVVAGVHEGCRQAGCALIGGETAEHAGVMAPDELDLAGFAVGVVEQGTQLGPDAGAARATPWSGCPRPGCAPTATPWPATCCSSGPGSSSATRPGPGPTHSVADELLRPSVIYAPAVLAVRAALGDALHACAHITGGGIVGNLPRVLPDGLGAVLDRSAWEEPRIFAEIQRLGSVAEDEMDRVFNRGVGHGAGGRRRGRRRRRARRRWRRGRAGRRASIGEVVGRRAGVRFR